MKLLSAFLKLIRFTNLIFIVLTQLFFYYCIFLPLSKPDLIYFRANQKGEVLFFLLTLASFFIAAGGNLINDYFDLQIDNLNKPERVVVDKEIKRRWVIVWHLLFSLTGVIISFWVSLQSHQWIVFIGNFFSVILLFFYSTHFKKKLLIGNLVVALLSAWVLLVIYFYVGASFLGFHAWKNITPLVDMKRLFVLTIIYAVFAFVITLIREVVKDLEDMYGDAAFHCKTLPIVFGVPVSKVFAGVWIVVMILGLSLMQLYAWYAGWWWGVLYGVGFLIIPLMIVFKLLYKASDSTSYHFISRLLKWVMLMGIISMIFFKFLK